VEQQLEVELDLVVVEEEVEVEEAWLSEEGVSEVIDASSSSWLVELVSWLEALAEALGGASGRSPPRSDFGFELD